MRAVVQRVERASVSIDKGEPKAIGSGLVILIAVGHEDGPNDVQYVAEKIAGLRVFEDDRGKMNLSVQEITGGACLIVSQFTLYADCRKGRRPSFTDAAGPDLAIPLYEAFVHSIREGYGINTVTGEFGADMIVEIHNQGPVTLLIDSKKLF